MPNTILAKLAVLISAETAELKKGLQSAGKDLNSFTSGLKSIAATVGVAFGAKEVAQFGFEVAKLAGEAEGVRAAFQRLPDSAKLMGQLKEATHDTVSELDLMKRTVQASNFGIELESLPKLLEFAAIRAQQTGQSVDFLVDSIITGIGRKSPLILDNLGISAVRLKEQFGGAALEAQNIGDVAKAVGKIAGEELKKMGGFVDNTASKTQQLGATWENLKVTLGNFVNAVGLPKFLDNINERLNNLNEEIKTGGVSQKRLIQFIDTFNKLKVTDADDDFLKLIKESAEKLGVKLLTLKEDYTGIIKVFRDTRKDGIVWKDGKEEEAKAALAAAAAVKVYSNNLEGLTEKLKDQTELFSKTDANDKIKLRSLGDEILETQKLIDEINKLKAAREKDDETKRKILEPLTRTKDLDPKRVASIEIVRSKEDTVKEDLIDTGQIEKKTSIFERMNERIRATEKLTHDQRVAFDAEQQRQADEFQARQERIATTATQVGGIIGDAMGDAISGQQSFADALKGITSQILDLFLKQAIGGIIAGAGKSGAFPPIAIGLAVAGVAAISALFKKATGKSGGGGGGASVSAGRSNGSDRLKANTAVQDTAPTIETILRGQDLFVVMSRFEKNNKQTSTINKRG